MLSLPADTSFAGERFFHERRGIDKYLDLARGSGGELAGQRFQSALDQFVVVLTPSIDRNMTGAFVQQAVKGITSWTIVEPNHDGCARLGPESTRRLAPIGGRG